ncbi:Gfo/Idh/MocA family protein [Liquorilactobacillus satsumensis]|uniref:Gfo Idh MocA family oxidoreductase n=1 Tax=Liquorilactobacillus satsumensis DSM 16230 = JCM 12392 TaxID=1423801 RepID=A0A0R1V4Q9_9LACO|nr:Gfo/Idh/MocA family oxidoreductase [Liquorilactobacillus satsumensis]KRM00568.1 Gfo Idh MocA family oxidoreductase [Liquorilactobacillus satsumensis DSM 16230 = JCM 12392]MCP9313239.1 Gfo/Idh/MocA family oxidoreductase [Liquorilactobacillus satsumensis]MCP9329491.1 Gfo/Idh/MocA family oxidoreductase [Liquorilactobacillus satsumensis]MCP9360400.1 Gfo/Idh/MocA family oxidoreductase [Liquorilactobacillus satsumensis]
MTKIRYGIVGTSPQGQKFLAALKLSADSRIVGVVDGSEDQAEGKKLVTQFGVPKLYTSATELFEDKEVDVVYLAVKNEDHYESAKEALNNGKNVLLEKPFTRHKVGASELFQLASKKGLFIMEAQSALFLPIMQKVSDLLSKGAIGDLRFIEVKDKYDVTAQASWIKKLSAGGGALFNGGTNFLGIIQYLCGRQFSDWSGFEYNQVGEADTRCNLALKNGDVLVNVLLTTDFEIETKLVLYGTEGKIKIPNYWFSETALLENQQGTKRFVIDEQENDLVYEIAHINHCLQENKLTSPIVTPELTIQTLTIIESLYQKWYRDPLN